MKQKWLISSIIVLLMLSYNGQVFAENNDIAGHYFENEIRALEGLGIMNGDGKGHFFPDQNVTRAQFAAFLNRALQLPATESKPFIDIEDHILASEINNAAAAGIINGVGNDLFLPDRALTREEVALMVSRVLIANGLTAEPEPLSFKDASQIKYADFIQPIIKYGIMNGYPDETFRPKDSVTRAQTAAIIYKMYNLVEKVKNEQKKLESEKENNSNSSTNDSEKQDNSSLLVIANKLLNVYEKGMKRVRTYVNVGTEMKFLEDAENVIKVEVSGAEGYVNTDDVEVISVDEVKNRSYYKTVDGNLRHYQSQNGQYESYIFGPSPSFLEEGETDYSFDGKTFTNGVFYQYFNYLPLLTETTYTGDQLDEYIKSEYPNSPLIGMGDVFKQAEAETGVNALYLLAHAIHESAWGFSKIATEKFNLFGIQATDIDTYNSATQFNSFEESIMYAAQYIKDKYLTPGDGSFYSGSFLGHKGVGMNLFYASDPFWGQKIAGRMYIADKYLGGQDWNKYRLAISKEPSLNVRSGSSTKDKLQYQHRYAGVTMVVLDEVENSEGTWYKIKSDHPDYEEGYIYANGPLGNFAEIINE